MALKNRTAGEKLDNLTNKAKRKTANIIDGMRGAVSRAANRASRRLHKAGDKVRAAGSRIKDAGEKARDLA